ncbi:MAG: hypothetical protein ACUVTZ_09370 [Armatimonadota bacterium]
MLYFVAAVLAGLAGWIVAEPIRRRRQAEREGSHGLPFSRMLMRIVSAGCVVGIALLTALSPWVLSGKSRFAELMYWMAALLLALVLGLAGLVEMQLVRRDYLLGLRQLYRDLKAQSGTVRRSAPTLKVKGNGRGDQPQDGGGE